MRFALPLLAFTQLLGTVAIPLLLPSRGSTNLEARRNLYARAVPPKIRFPEGIPPHSPMGHEIRKAFHTHYKKELANNHPIKTTPHPRHVRLGGNWVKDPEEIREHILFHLHAGSVLTRHPGLAIGEPVKVYRDFTVNFGMHVPDADKPSIEGAVRDVRRLAGHPISSAGVANVATGWQHPPGSRPEVITQYLRYPECVQYPPDHPNDPGLIATCPIWRGDHHEQR